MLRTKYSQKATFQRNKLRSKQPFYILILTFMRSSSAQTENPQRTSPDNDTELYVAHMRGKKKPKHIPHNIMSCREYQNEYLHQLLSHLMAAQGAYLTHEVEGIYFISAENPARPLRFMTLVVDIPAQLIYFNTLRLQRQICSAPIFRDRPLFLTQPSQTTHTSKLPLRSC